MSTLPFRIHFENKDVRHDLLMSRVEWWIIKDITKFLNEILEIIFESVAYTSTYPVVAAQLVRCQSTLPFAC